MDSDQVICMLKPIDKPRPDCGVEMEGEAWLGCRRQSRDNLFGVAESSRPTEVRLPGLHAPGTVSIEAGFVFPKGARGRTHAHRR